MGKATKTRVYITGRVQGVGFRQATLAQARQFPALKGWVRNLPDGRVEAVFQGDTHEVAAMVEWCHRGPRFANVTSVEVVKELGEELGEQSVSEPTGETLGAFEIRFSES